MVTAKKFFFYQKLIHSIFLFFTPVVLESLVIIFHFFFHLIPFLTCEALLIIFSAFTSNGLKTTTTSKRNITYSNKKWNYMGFCSQAQKVQVCHMIPRQSLRVEGLPINFQLLLFVVRWSMAMQISRNKRIFYMRKEFNHHSILLVSLRSRRRKR